MDPHLVIGARVVWHVLEDVRRAGEEAPVGEHLQTKLVRVDLGQRGQAVRELWSARAGHHDPTAFSSQISPIEARTIDVLERCASVGQSGRTSDADPRSVQVDRCGEAVNPVRAVGYIDRGASLGRVSNLGSSDRNADAVQASR